MPVFPWIMSLTLRSSLRCKTRIRWLIQSIQTRKAMVFSHKISTWNWPTTKDLRRESTWLWNLLSTWRHGKSTSPLRIRREQLLLVWLLRHQRLPCFSKSWANSRLSFPRSATIKPTCKQRRHNFQVSNTTSRFHHQRNITRSESLLLVTLPLKAMVLPPKSKFCLSHWKKDLATRLMDRNKDLRAGHSCFTACSRVTTKPLTTRSWTMEFKMPQSFQTLSTSLSKMIADMKCSWNRCQISFSFPSDPWMLISKTSLKKSLRSLTWSWSRMSRNFQLDQWSSWWYQFQLALTNSMWQQTQRSMLISLPILQNALSLKRMTCKNKSLKLLLWPISQELMSSTLGKCSVIHREKRVLSLRTTFIQTWREWVKSPKNSSWRCPSVQTTLLASRSSSPARTRFTTRSSRKNSKNRIFTCLIELLKLRMISLFELINYLSLQLIKFRIK